MLRLSVLSKRPRVASCLRSPSCVCLEPALTDAKKLSRRKVLMLIDEERNPVVPIETPGWTW